MRVRLKLSRKLKRAPPPSNLKRNGEIIDWKTTTARCYLFPEFFSTRKIFILFYYSESTKNNKNYPHETASFRCRKRGKTKRKLSTQTTRYRKSKFDLEKNQKQWRQYLRRMRSRWKIGGDTVNEVFEIRVTSRWPRRGPHWSTDRFYFPDENSRDGSVLAIPKQKEIFCKKRKERKGIVLENPFETCRFSQL